MTRLRELWWLELMVWSADGGGVAAAAAGATPAGGATGAGDGKAAASPSALVAAAAATAAAGDGKPGDGKAGDGKDAGEPGPQTYFPKGLPEQFRGTNERETLDKIAQEFSSRPKPPDKADGYELKLEPKLAERFGDMKDDKVLPMWREVALELGLSQEQFNGAFSKLYGRMAEAGLIDDPVSIEREFGKLEPESGDPAQRRAEAKRRVNAAATWIDGLVTREVLSTGEAAEVAERLLVNAAGVTAIEKIMKLGREHGLQGGGGEPGGDTKEGLQALMRDPRYDLRGGKGDPDFVTDVDARWRRLHGA